MRPAALITGGGTGIGAATARVLAAEGWLVGLVGRRPVPLAAVAAETGGLALAGDACELEHLERSVTALAEAGGTLRALICSAGGGNAGTALTQTQEGFEAVLKQNLTAPFLASKACLPALTTNGGSIVIVASLAGLRAGPASVAYGSAKAGAIHLARMMAVDHSPHGVRVNAVCPGWVRTPMADDALADLATQRGSLDAAYTEATKHAPARRPAEAGEVANTIAWLISERAAGITGATLTVDGGAHIVDAEGIAFLPES
jgi:meso-butanediol dehydrogenase/(S,S)-butanediol dehydrogenase/diacetyl reductase